MVFHLFERIFGTWGDPKGALSYDENYEHLVRNGFSAEEAKNLNWLNTKQNRGKYWGTLGGIWVVYITRSSFASYRAAIPRFRHQPYWIPLARIGIVVSGYLIGDYFGTSSSRKGSNDQWSWLWKNNEFLFTREAFIEKYETMNRKFTLDEISQFWVNEMKKVKPRKWIYNPALHGDEVEWTRAVNMLEAGNVVKDPAVQKKIREQNKQKIEYAERLLDRPFDVNEVVDRTGEKQNVQKFPILTGWRPLE